MNLEAIMPNQKVDFTYTAAFRTLKMIYSERPENLKA